MKSQSKVEKLFLIVCQAGFLLCLTLSLPLTIKEGIRDNSVIGVIASFLFSTLAWTVLFWLAIRRWVIPKKPAGIQWLISMLPALVVITGVTILFSRTTERRPKLGDDYWGVISQVCEGVGIPEAASYTGSAGIHKAVMVDSDGDSIWYTSFSLNWQPDSVANTELVVCIGDTECEQKGYCTYTNGVSLKKNRCHRWIRLISAQTGEVVSSREFYGDEPKCPGSVGARRTSPVSGGDIDHGEFMDWLAPFVEP